MPVSLIKAVIARLFWVWMIASEVGKTSSYEGCSMVFCELEGTNKLLVLGVNDKFVFKISIQRVFFFSIPL